MRYFQVPPPAPFDLIADPVMYTFEKFLFEMVWCDKRWSQNKDWVDCFERIADGLSVSAKTTGEWIGLTDEDHEKLVTVIKDVPYAPHAARVGRRFGNRIILASTKKPKELEERTNGGAQLEDKESEESESA